MAWESLLPKIESMDLENLRTDSSTERCAGKTKKAGGELVLLRMVSDLVSARATITMGLKAKSTIKKKKMSAAGPPQPESFKQERGKAMEPATIMMMEECSSASGKITR